MRTIINAKSSCLLSELWRKLVVFTPPPKVTCLILSWWEKGHKKPSPWQTVNIPVAESARTAKHKGPGRTCDHALSSLAVITHKKCSLVFLVAVASSHRKQFSQRLHSLKGFQLGSDLKAGTRVYSFNSKLQAGRAINGGSKRNRQQQKEEAPRRGKNLKSKKKSLKEELKIIQEFLNPTRRM